MKSMKPINDGQRKPGHVCACQGCGKTGVYCESGLHNAGTIVIDGEEILVRGVGTKYEILLTGKLDDSEPDKLFCEDCATDIEVDE